MPVKRRIIKGREHRITPEAVEFWVKARAIQDAGEAVSSSARWEEYLDNWSSLNRALGIRPWQISPLNVDDDEQPPANSPPGYWTESFPTAQALRRQLLSAARPR